MGDARPTRQPLLMYFLFLALLLALAVYGKGWIAGGERAAQTATPGAPVSTIPDFAAVEDVDIRKALFFDFLQPFIDAENARILTQRRELQRLRDKLGEGLMLTRRETAFVST